MFPTIYNVSQQIIRFLYTWFDSRTFNASSKHDISILIKMWTSASIILAGSAFYLLYKENTGDTARGGASTRFDIGHLKKTTRSPFPAVECLYNTESMLRNKGLHIY